MKRPRLSPRAVQLIGAVIVALMIARAIVSLAGAFHFGAPHAP